MSCKGRFERVLDGCLSRLLGGNNGGWLRKLEFKCKARTWLGLTAAAAGDSSGKISEPARPMLAVKIRFGAWTWGQG